MSSAQRRVVVVERKAAESIQQIASAAYIASTRSARDWRGGRACGCARSLIDALPQSRLAPTARRFSFFFMLP